jgi:hypothetical protein
MSWSNTTATDYKDALADLRTLAITTNGNWAEGVGVAGGRYNTGTEDEWIATGNGSGSDAITMGVRTYSDEQFDYYNWELAGMDSYTDANTWENQPGISPGRHDGAGNAAFGSYVPLANRGLEYWYSVTSRRMTGVLRVGNVYTFFYLGWGMPHDTVGNFADPKCVTGTMTDPAMRYNQGHVAICSPIHPLKHVTSGREGPMQFHNRAGSWETVANRTYSDASTVVSTQVTSGNICWPCGRINIASLATGADSWVSTAVEGAANALVWQQVVPSAAASSNHPGLQRAILKRTPDPTATQDAIPRKPVVIFEATESHMTLDGVYWVSAAGGSTDADLMPEDSFADGGTNYHVFPIGSVNENWNYIAIEEK